MEKAFLRRTHRILGGHLWVFSNELVKSPKGYEPGSLVRVYDMHNTFLGIGYINPASLIAIRLLSRTEETIDAGFFRNRIAAALRYRQDLGLASESCRIVYSEGDFLPGLIVDKYAETVAVQFLTFGMERQKETVLGLLDEALAPAHIVVRNDSSIRLLEGLPLYKEVVKGSVGSMPVISEGGLRLAVDVFSGQKTGFFLDQRENRIAFSHYVNGGAGLDLFSYSGAWALQTAARGAQVSCVDSSESALALIASNAEMNGLTDRIRPVKDDVFTFLKNELDAGMLYDFIVLDPPAFVKSSVKLREGLRGYREVNTSAMRLLKPGGLLATSSCSYHVDRVTFLDMIHRAARDAGRTPRVLDVRSQARDHPILLDVPETEYLTCVFLKM
jgi:23S rRNA (cytosine1962-C5)-methyltransferase